MAMAILQVGCFANLGLFPPVLCCCLTFSCFFLLLPMACWFFVVGLLLGRLALSFSAAADAFAAAYFFSNFPAAACAAGLSWSDVAVVACVGCCCWVFLLLVVGFCVCWLLLLALLSMLVCSSSAPVAGPFGFPNYAACFGFCSAG